ncbi:GtrA family protein [Sphingomonas sp. ASV193]|uniref:GtrA family protein n=1 Tax=Sphingomonas sp. ASV193 TaxID=3144405 RepID=UPI0032E879A3
MVQSVINRLEPEHRATLVQLARYGLAGGIITIGVAASFYLLAETGWVGPMTAFTIVFLVFSGISYAVHGAYSFKDHGARDNHHVRGFRFLLVNLLGYAINQGFVWYLVKHLHGPNWWPTIPMVFFTPLVTFALHRKFVYA